MLSRQQVDGILVQWGDRLFYPGNRTVPSDSPKLRRRSHAERADALRERIGALIRRAPQVMVKVTGGGRGMKAIVAHFRYISKNGRLEIEDERGERSRGPNAVRELADVWRYGGSYIPDESPRREAFNIILSMPRGTDVLALQRAARELASEVLADHKYAMVVHDHQANPHVHLCVRAESQHGARLNPRKADLHRWREVFAEKLRGWGIDAEATRQVSRGVFRGRDPLARRKARDEGRSRLAAPQASRASTAWTTVARSWQEVSAVLEASADLDDRRLADSIRKSFGPDLGPRNISTPAPMRQASR